MDTFSLFSELTPASELPSTDTEAVSAMYRRMQLKMQEDRPARNNVFEKRSEPVSQLPSVTKTQPINSRKGFVYSRYKTSPLKSIRHKKTTERLMVSRSQRAEREGEYPGLPRASYDFARSILDANQETSKALTVPPNAALSTSWVDYDGLGVSISRESFREQAEDNKLRLLANRDVRKGGEQSYPGIPTDSVVLAHSIMRTNDDMLSTTSKLPQDRALESTRRLRSPIKSPMSEYSQIFDDDDYGY